MFTNTDPLSFFSVLQTVISDVDIQDMVDIFKLSDLDDLYPRLDLSHKDVENAKLRAETPKQKEKMVLYLWRDRNADSATREVMLQAMSHNEDWTADVNRLKIKWGYATGKLNRVTPHRDNIIITNHLYRVTDTMFSTTAALTLFNHR